MNVHESPNGPSMSLYFQGVSFYFSPTAAPSSPSSHAMLWPPTIPAMRIRSYWRDAMPACHLARCRKFRWIKWMQESGRSGPMNFGTSSSDEDGQLGRLTGPETGMRVGKLKP